MRALAKFKMFQNTAFKHCLNSVLLTDPCLSKVTYRQLTKNHRDASQFAFIATTRAELVSVNVYTQHKLLFFGVFTRELYLFVYKSIHFDDRLHYESRKNARYNLKIVNFNGLDLCIWGELSHSRSRYKFCFQIITNVNNLLYSFS